MSDEHDAETRFREAHSMSDNPGTLIAKHVRKISHYEGITEGQASVLRQAAQTIDRLTEALTQSERKLTELGTAFRDYKIVHPEGTR